MLIIDDSNYQTLIGDGSKVESGGVTRLLSGTPKPEGHDSSGYSTSMARDGVSVIPRNEWDARITELEEMKGATSQIQTWTADDQGSHPTCWAAGFCATYSTAQVRMGVPWVRYSAMAIAVPISGGNSGGYEGDSVALATKRGMVEERLWGYTDRTNRDRDPAVIANRLLHKCLGSYECNSFDEFATACLLGLPCVISYNWWSHVVMLCDLVRIEAGSYGFRIRNNWGESFGDKNIHGMGGYAVFREGKGTPSGGFAVHQVQATYSKAA